MLLTLCHTRKKLMVHRRKRQGGEERREERAAVTISQVHHSLPQPASKPVKAQIFPGLTLTSPCATYREALAVSSKKTSESWREVTDGSAQCTGTGGTIHLTTRENAERSDLRGSKQGRPSSRVALGTRDFSFTDFSKLIHLTLLKVLWDTWQNRQLSKYCLKMGLQQLTGTANCFRSLTKVSSPFFTVQDYCTYTLHGLAFIYMAGASSSLSKTHFYRKKCSL